MSPGGEFLDNARNIFEAAQNVFFSTGSMEPMSVLVSGDGGIHLVANSDWSLESLQAHHGARMAYRVSQRQGRVLLEGRAGVRTCLFEAGKPDGAARLLLANTPAYAMARPGLHQIP
jgi:hypothetical protein